ncbi:nicotinamide phosphoribosyltransferase [Eurytemora carolleeae]|uniref:nicotinamide phosphoribosyltransferase n=1 Tax=Eurytemora carolleeae TaxID=1294199 RepID=UPI000C775E91|nr:nicotinamide phosphoribosyltransferase [Eurytemora carolleeae]|eukprot:XP_023333671.1 nicotinamide phosphoribosyltransferase-like [Eurytemora affinis]
MGPELNNVILLADSYKISHHLQYPPGTTRVYSYFESRGGKYDKTVFFGLQYILKKWLVGQVLNQQMIDEAEIILNRHFKGAKLFNREGWEYILHEHKGRLPLRIRAAPEGSVLPTKNVLFSVENTDPKVPWLTNYVETVLVQTWYPTTVATGSYFQKLKIAEYLSETAESMDKLPIMLHDFGYRGSSSVESAGIGGLAHLVNFEGSDTLAALFTAEKYYGENNAAFSVPATEHSTMTSWGRDGESAAVRYIMDKVPTGPISIVSDSYDIFNMVEHIMGEELKEKIESRDGVLIVRPDSGEPSEMVLKTLNLIGEKFGYTVNSLGYRVLPPYISVVQGDGICYESLEKILKVMKENRWSAENLCFGSGGALLQKMDRDTQKCAYKCSYVEVDGKGIDVFKDPVTDHKKKSKKGRLVLIKQDGEFQTVREEETTQEDEMFLVFENGELVKDWSLSEVRARAWSRKSKD